MAEVSAEQALKNGILSGLMTYIGGQIEPTGEVFNADYGQSNRVTNTARDYDLTPSAEAEQKTNKTLFWGLLGLAFLMFLVLVVMLLKGGK